MRGVTFADTVTLLLVELAKKKSLKGNRTYKYSSAIPSVCSVLCFTFNKWWM